MRRTLIAALSFALGMGGVWQLPSWSCCSLAPASFSATKGLASETRMNGKVVHLLGYQNRALNKSTASGGNAMLLPIPAKPGTMTERNILNTRFAPNILDDMAKLFPEESTDRQLTLRDGIAKAGGSGFVHVFQSDIYTIVLAQNAQDLPAALSRVPEAKRPRMNKAIFDAYAKWYPNHTFALCCFNNRDAAVAKPMLWWYEPIDKEKLFFPGLDEHDGSVPSMKSRVSVDHALAFSTPAFTHANGREVLYTDKLAPFLKDVLPVRIQGERLKGTMPQGDFSVDLPALRQGICIIERVLPPGLMAKSLGPAKNLLAPEMKSRRW